jgi:hypothetical protein
MALFLFFMARLWRDSFLLRHVVFISGGLFSLCSTQAARHFLAVQ